MFEGITVILVAETWLTRNIKDSRSMLYFRIKLHLRLCSILYLAHEQRYELYDHDILIGGS